MLLELSLHYAEVKVGTPAVSYLVALDTGSDLFWLPCDCVNCVTGLNSSSGVIFLKPCYFCSSILIFRGLVDSFLKSLT